MELLDDGNGYYHAMLRRENTSTGHWRMESFLRGAKLGEPVVYRIVPGPVDASATLWLGDKQHELWWYAENWKMKGVSFMFAFYGVGEREW